MNIDINQPVEKGHDMVLNNPDGTQELGTAKEFAKRKEAGELSGLHTNEPVAAHNESVEKVAESKNEPKTQNEPTTQEDKPMDEDKTRNAGAPAPQKASNERLSDEQTNKSAEDRTAGEVEQTENARNSQPEAESSDASKDKSKPVK